MTPILNPSDRLLKQAYEQLECNDPRAPMLPAIKARLQELGLLDDPSQSLESADPEREPDRNPDDYSIAS
jgi:hypothetical protein